jgi:transcriptional regulator with XRE-family HTH domain
MTQASHLSTALCSRAVLLSGSSRGRQRPVKLIMSSQRRGNIMIVKKLRNKNDWSQEQLAEYSGLNVRTIQRVESGQTASIETLKCLASVFEVNISTLTEEITVIDKQSENWKIQPWWFKWSFWKIRSRQSQVMYEKALLILGIMAWIAGLTMGFINHAGSTVGAPFESFGLVYGSFVGPFFILTAYCIGKTISHGDKENLW